jgi:pimeloyl-ACP methyl ester carboxylesterase
MNIVGSGPPLVVVPGIQGRWEYVRPAIEALAASFRVVTFPLCGERSSGRLMDPSRGLDNYVDQIAAVMTQADMPRATICGVSFGGLAALRFAATHPEQTDALVLVSTPAPGWRLRPRHHFYARFPRLMGPLFLLETPRRLRAEFAAAFPERSARRRFAFSQLRVLLEAPISLTAMAQRAIMIETADTAADCARVLAPTLVVTGEPHLDHVVPAGGSADYSRLIAGARTAIIERTGHLGSITRPDVFAAAIRDFSVERPAGKRQASEHDAA